MNRDAWFSSKNIVHQGAAWAHSETGSHHIAVTQCTADSQGISDRGTVAICSTTNRIHFSVQNAPRESDMCRAVRLVANRHWPWLGPTQSHIYVLKLSSALSLSMQLHHEHHEFTSNVIELHTIGRRPHTCAHLRNNQGKQIISPSQSCINSHLRCLSSTGKSTVPAVNNSVCECFHWRWNRRGRSILVDAVLFSCDLHQNNGLQWLILNGDIHRIYTFIYFTKFRYDFSSYRMTGGTTVGYFLHKMLWSFSQTNQFPNFCIMHMHLHILHQWLQNVKRNLTWCHMPLECRYMNKSE